MSEKLPEKGEGNREADRVYRERIQKAMKDGDTEQRAREAADAVQGEERKELERAEERAKRGPKS